MALKLQTLLNEYTAGIAWNQMEMSSYSMQSGHRHLATANQDKLPSAQCQSSVQQQVMIHQGKRFLRSALKLQLNLKHYMRQSQQWAYVHMQLVTLQLYQQRNNVSIYCSVLCVNMYYEHRPVATPFLVLQISGLPKSTNHGEFSPTSQASKLQKKTKKKTINYSLSSARAESRAVMIVAAKQTRMSSIQL